MTLAFLCDEHVKRVFVRELRANGYSVEWVSENYEAGRSDTEHLEYAVENGLVLLTNDTDFLRLHDDYRHSGLVVYDDQNVSVSEFMRGLKRIERFVPEPELEGALIWLDEWTD